MLINYSMTTILPAIPDFERKKSQLLQILKHFKVPLSTEQLVKYTSPKVIFAEVQVILRYLETSEQITSIEIPTGKRYKIKL